MSSTPTPNLPSGGARRGSEPTAALFVRIPTEHARRLDRAAFELKVPKQSLVSELLERYVDPDSPASLAALHDGGSKGRRRVTVETLDQGGLTLGHHSFRPRAPEVLTPEEAAELLQVQAEVVLELACSGELPGRELGGQWRFARAALLDWLGAGTAAERVGRATEGSEG
jgi:excisionase family DNA binding protein